MRETGRRGHCPRLVLLLAVLGACAETPTREVPFMVDRISTGDDYQARARLPAHLKENPFRGFGTTFERQEGVSPSALDAVTFALHDAPRPQSRDAAVTRRRSGRAEIEERRFSTGALTFVWTARAEVPGLWKTCTAELGGASGGEVSWAAVREAERVCASFEVTGRPVRAGE